MENNPVPVDNDDKTQSSNIDGIGYWNTCLKQFDNAYLACFDLIDNVFDASPQVQGRVMIDVDVEREKDEEDKSRIRELELETTNGFYILNNCQNPVKPMRDVLKVFNSDKVANSQIGENGVGVKQGCARLSEISFVMSRNENVYSLGILARSLQSNSRIYFPSFEYDFKQDIEMDLYEFLTAKITATLALSKYRNIAAVVKEYGHDNFEKGRYRLVKNIMRMSEEEWTKDKYVFCICVHHLNHSTENDDFLLDLIEQLPSRYLHVPHTFQVRIGPSFRVKFNHWPSRLANLTRFVVRVPKDELVSGENLEGTENEHTLNVYLGFDVIRIKDKKMRKTASIYCYSRKFGRLIESEVDCRGTLNFNQSGSDLCQALTIVVDDKCGALPLRPNKQKFAFGQHANGGKIWKKNLLKWVSAVTKAYYDYCLKNLCGTGKGKKKEILTKLVKDCYDQLESRDSSFEQRNRNINKTLDELQVSRLVGIKWKYSSKNEKVYVTKKENVKESIGKDIDLFLKSQIAIERLEKKSTTRQTCTQIENGEDDRTVETMISSVREGSRSIEIGDATNLEEKAHFISTNSVESKGTFTSRKRKRHREEFEEEENELQIENTQLRQELDEAKLELEDLYNTLSVRDGEIKRLKMALSHEKVKNSIVEL